MTFPLVFEKTSRGFGFWKFTDRYQHSAVILESSLATEAAIWFGCYEPQRMHLTRDMVKALLPILEYFAQTGDLPEVLPIPNEIRIPDDDEDEELCSTCGGPNDNGEGYDGECGDCADRTSNLNQED